MTRGTGLGVVCGMWAAVIRLPIERVVEKEAAVEQPAYGLMREQSKKSGCQVDYIQCKI